MSVSTLAIAHLVTFGLAALLLGLAAWHDAQRYKIPNGISLALLLLFPIYLLTAERPLPWVQHLVIGGIVLGLGFLMFAKNIVGAGDVKLLAVTSLWAGPQQIALFVITTAIAGGLLGLAVAVIAWRRNTKLLAKGESIALAKVPIPYGIAIAVGGYCLLLSLFNQLQLSDLWTG